MIIKNLAMGVVVTPPSTPTAGTTATLRAGEGAYFGSTFPFLATTAPPDQLSNPNYAEIILVTGKSTDQLTFVRAKRGTSAKSIAAGWIIANGIYTEDVNGVAVTVATAAATATKVGTTTDADYTPALGDKLLVTFSNGMNVASPTLNIDGSGVKAINVGNVAVNTNLFSTTSAVTVPMFYDGTAYQLYGSYTTNADTVDSYHANATPTANTLVPLDSGAKLPIAANTSGIMRQIGIVKRSNIVKDNAAINDDNWRYFRNDADTADLSLTVTCTGTVFYVDLSVVLWANLNGYRNARVVLDGTATGEVFPMSYLQDGVAPGVAIATITTTPGSHTLTFQWQRQGGASAQVSYRTVTARAYEVL